MTPVRKEREYSLNKRKNNVGAISDRVVEGIDFIMSDNKKLDTCYTKQREILILII